MTKFAFCSDLNSPELGVIMDHKWAQDNSDNIKKTPGIYFLSECERKLSIGDLFMIPNKKDRLLFVLKWM